MAVLALLLASAYPLFSQSNPWVFIPETSVTLKDRAARQIVPQQYETLRLEVSQMKKLLDTAPLWQTEAAENQPLILVLPMPDGSFQQFRVAYAPVMHPDLAAKYPEIRSYAGTGIDDPTAYLRFDMTPKGFHAFVRSGNHSDAFIDPYSTGDIEHYVAYYKKDFFKDTDWACSVDAVNDRKGKAPTIPGPDKMAGDCQLRTYRLALACTGEYATFHGGTVADAMAAINTTMTRVNGVTETDLTIHMSLVANNDQLVYLDPNTDPYTNNNGSAMLGENQTTCDNVIGSANYDIGHVFSTGGGGVAYLACVCNNSIKAGGVTGQPNPVGDPFDIDYVAHEMGHQYGANHTQNNNCQRNNATAMEPGSASTIMGYAGICSPNVQNNSDAYYHAISMQEIGNFVTGGGNSCAAVTATGSQPTANAGANYTIPRSTSFVLSGTGSDPDPGDVLTYCWEQMDNQIATMPPASTNTGGPAFRSLSPTSSEDRYFPNLNAIINNQTPTWEVLPSVGRTMNFRFTVRDNHPNGGCTAEDDMVVTVSGSAGPFLVTAPNTAVTWAALSTQTITWDVANTTAAPVNAANVDIFLSTDGGLTYPVTLATNTPNDGSQSLTIPNNPTSQARVMVRGAGNIFFDISNTDFTISAPANGFTVDVSPNSQSVCAPANAVYTVDVGATGNFNGNVTLSVTGVPAGASASFSVNPVAAPGTSQLTISGTGSVTPGTYSLTVTGTNGSDTQSETVSLTVIGGAPGAVVLSAPANGATGVSATPTLSWSASAGANTYDVQVATDAAFTNLAVDVTGVTGTSHTVANSLNTNTLYYWRVRGVNGCGNGAYSSSFSFTTANITCTTYASPNVPVTIPSSGTPTVTSTLTISDAGTIDDVNVLNLDISHTWINDLIIKLKSPAGTEITLIDQICNSEDDILTNFDDESTNAYSSLPCPPTNNGTYQPNQALSAFDGEDLNGTWTLTIQDVFNQDGGTLNAWSLDICYSASSTPLTVTTSSTDVSCNGAADGTATANASGGTGSYSYSWSNGGTTQTISNLSPNTYSVTVTSGSESVIATVTIAEPSALVASATGTNTSCGNNNGSATANGAGGTAPYSFSWSNGGTTQTINNLGAGTYTVTITDANNCTDAASVTVQGSTGVSATASGTNVSCNGGNDGAATANPSGGAAPYSYSWNNGGTSQTISSLTAGTYSVTVTDNNGCTATANVTVAQPSALSVVVTGTNPTSGNNDGTATATPAGGTATYSYNWSNGGTTQTITGLAAGTYNVTVTDANNCTATGSITLTAGSGITCGTFVSTNVPVTIPSSGTPTVTSTSTINASGAIDDVNMLNLDISHTWINDLIIKLKSPAGTEITLIDQICNSEDDILTNFDDESTNAYSSLPCPPTNNGTYQPFQALSAFDGEDLNGTWTLTIQDVFNQDGGTLNAWSLEVCYDENAIPLTVSVTGVDPTNGNNGSATAAPAGGATPYSYAWSNGGTTQTITGLGAGTYTVTVTDANSATATGSVTLTSGGCTYTTIDDEDFEAGWGIWNDGGSDCRRSSNDSPYANSGIYCIRLRDNTSTSVMTTDNLDLSAYDELSVDFSYYVRSFDNSNEDFWLQVSTNGGSTYTTVEEWNLNDEFLNNQRKFDVVTIAGPFTTNTRLRFRADASGNSDWVYIDDVLIEGCAPANVLPPVVNAKPSQEEGIEEPQTQDETTGAELLLYPNPASDVLRIKYEKQAADNLSIRVFDMQGKTLIVKQVNDRETLEVDVSQLRAGYYLLQLIDGGERMVAKFVKVKAD